MKTLIFGIAMAISLTNLNAQTTVTKSGSVFYDSDPGSGEVWSNPENIAASDNQRANISIGSLIGGGTTYSHYLVAKGFSFAIPSHATITAVQVSVERRRTSGNVYDNLVQLLKGSLLVGDNKAATTTNWPGTDASALYGNTSSDLWGTTLTPAEVNSPNFGLALIARLDNPALILGSVGADIDHVQIAVTYTTNTAPDKDGDGIPDAIDFDADNDGIANNRERTRCTGTNNFNWTSQPDNTNPSTVDVTAGSLTVFASRSGTPAVATYTINNAYSATTEKEVQVIQAGSTPTAKTTLVFALSKPIANPRFIIQDVDRATGQFTDNVRILASYMGQQYVISAAEITTSSSNTFIGSNTIQGTAAAADNTTNGQVTLSLNTIVDKIEIEYWNSDAAAGSQGMGFGGITYCDITTMDTDGDGKPDYLDSDSDGDGIQDIVEAGGVDVNRDGRIDGTFADSDGDGLHNMYDATTGGTQIVYGDFDKDGIPNTQDLDSDGDGINDVLEAGLPDTDKNGIADNTADANNDGWSDTVAALSSFTLRNSDGDTLPDYQDIDSDNDGISDNIEGQSTASYKLPAGTDADKDGIDDKYDNNNAAFGGSANNGIIPVDSDSDNIPDYRDTDSDNDGNTDIKEGHDLNGNGLYDDLVTLTGTDTDGDGLDDRFDIITGPTVTQNGMMTSGAVGNPPSAGATGPLQKTVVSYTDRDWRHATFVILASSMLDFNANPENKAVRLQWTVANEDNTDKYIIEKSTDQIQFTAIASVSAKNLASEKTAYTVTDKNPANGNNYYRIKSVDKNGKVTLTSIRIVTMDTEIQTVSIYPNPVISQLFVKAPDSYIGRRLTVRMNDAQGRMTGFFTKLPGENQIIINAGTLHAGYYTVSVIGDKGDLIKTEKIVVSKQ